MAKRSLPPTRLRSAGRLAARDASTERWLLLLTIVITIVAFVGLLDVRAPLPHPARRLSMAQARASNAAVPIERGQRVSAARFRFRGGSASRAQAVDCLATAALYEAGDDRRGQEAVIQVVLNRVRAPGFPKTICGVVYQGHTRATGCQFSFTCDGSVVRRRERRGWEVARRAANRALAGRVFDEVGSATLYHADWTVPYWRDTVVKVARVGTHLFYVRQRRSSGPVRRVGFSNNSSLPSATRPG